VPGDLPLRAELDLQGPAPHCRHGLDEPDPQRGESTAEVVAVRTDPLERAQQHAGRCVVRAACGDGLEDSVNPGVALRKQQLLLRDDAEFLFDDTVVALTPDGSGVEVTFDRAAPRRFDAVVGADGLHSTVRRLAFGPEREFVRHMGVYVATMPLGQPVDHPTDILMYNTPGRLVSIHPSRGDALVAFIFRGAEIPGFDHRDTELHRRIVLDAYAGVGWRVPELLERVRTAPDLYFDSVSHVRLPSWSRGRIALLGDAASCVSLFGDGSSLAMAGAATLADALASDEVEPAFHRYEAAHRTLVGPKQRHVGRAAALIVPKTRAGIAVRNVAAKLWPASV
jgi:2-polyprenyl-6-methoxyphenol hydroxylase-like FAD-dependent oxidoreductase